ncbi:Aldo/keto reductase [Aspergillus lucknowensis]|uniref:Aldo/keto reductase n=1 Tax=Aspergillus lucknowensis TaxID=176173 RepID=A0ABR4LX10_9EURO
MLHLRPLGRNGPPVPCLGLGFGSLGGSYGPPGPLEERVALLDHAHATGLRFWDLADIYGDSEDLVGEWIKRSGKRDDIFLATKFGLQRQANAFFKFCSEPKYVRAACEQSLRRLGVETIDLYYCHRVDGVTPIERTIEAMVELKDQGKIRHLGLSEVSAATLRRAHAVHPIAALQVEYSLFTLDIESPESELLKTARELGITVVAFSPIGRGILSGQFRARADLPAGDLRTFYPKYAEDNFPEIMKLVRGLDSIARGHECTPAQVALAWLLAQGPDIIPIPGTKSAAKMEENAAAARVELSEEEVQEIRTLAERADIHGTRYPAAVMATLFTETPPL